MLADYLQALRQAARSSDRLQRAQAGFQLLIRPPQRGDKSGRTAAARSELRQLIANWIREVPVRDTGAEQRLLALRLPASLLCSASGFDWADCVHDALQGAPGTQPADWPLWKQQKLALLGDVGLIDTPTWLAWHERQPELASLFATQALVEIGIEASRHQAWNELAEAVATRTLSLPAHALGSAQAAAFHTTYLSTAAKHRCKAALVAAMRERLRSLEATYSAPPPGPGKPRLLVIGEQLISGHAMLRCYGDALASLREHFEVALLAEASSACAEHRQFATQVRYFPTGGWQPAALVAAVRELSPQIILYPSLGMSAWTFALGALRLAPLQLASVGHPGPACSPCIDGTLIFEPMCPAQPDPGFARLLPYQDQALPGLLARPAAAHEAPPAATRWLGVNAALMKLNADFLAEIRALLEAAPAGTRLRLFPNVGGLEFEAAHQRLQACFPDAEIRPAEAPAGYQRALAECRLIVQTFPFGGTNTTLDALQLGVPVLCLAGDGVEAAVDPLLLQMAGRADWVCADRATLRARALALLAADTRPAAAELPTRVQHGAGAALRFADAVLQAWQQRRA